MRFALALSFCAASCMDSLVMPKSSASIFPFPFLSTALSTVPCALTAACFAFATLALQNGMDVKTLSAMLGHVSAATTLDIYTHITDDMRLTAAANIDRGIGKAAPQEDASEPGQETAPAQAEKPRMTDFKPYVGRKRRSGTGCVSQINDHLFEGRYSPKWPDGKKHARNVYAHTREECEEKLKVLIAEMKAELAELKRQKGDRH